MRVVTRLVATERDTRRRRLAHPKKMDVEVYLRSEIGRFGLMVGVGGHLAQSCTERHCLQFKYNCFAEMRSDSEEGSYLRLIDLRITQL